jgi:hypothetical protein
VRPRSDLVDTTIDRLSIDRLDAEQPLELAPRREPDVDAQREQEDDHRKKADSGVAAGTPPLDARLPLRAVPRVRALDSRWVVSGNVLWRVPSASGLRHDEQV